MTQERFKVELVMEEGQIVDIVSLDKDNVHVYEPVASLDKIDPDQKNCAIQHGTILLSGQNSPGCFWVRTSRGYIKVCR